MRIHLQSDMHLEFGSGSDGNVASDVCVCAGDIGLLCDSHQRKLLLEHFKGRKDLAEHVIWVLGNHEFYDMDYNEGLAFAADLADQAGVILMDEALGTDNQVIDGVTFWGTTLWSDAKGDDWFARKKIADGINDFYSIKDGVRNFSVHKMQEINRRSREKINWDADVCVTHFPPIVIPHPEFSLTDLSYYFYNTRLDQQICDSNIKLWLSGHTHHSAVVELEGTICASNQHGYVRNYTDGQKWLEQSGFDPGFILEI